MRGRDGIISQKTVKKPFEKAASVDVAALTALLDKTQKRKKKSPALFSTFSEGRRFGETAKENAFQKTPKARGA